MTVNTLRMNKGVAGMLLCAILSDTLNLMGPTTTDWDRMMVAVLVEIAQVKDINALVKAQFKAKSKELESKFTVLTLLHNIFRIFNCVAFSFDYNTALQR